MKILCLETSTKKFSLAVCGEEKILAAKTVQLKGVLSSSIIPAIERILLKSKISFPGIDCLAIGLGPGSFTSLRVGLSTIKALSLATDKPVIGIPSLDALALSVLSKTADQICPIMDAKRNLVYTCLYQNFQGQLKRRSDYMLISPVELAERIKEDTLLTGDAVKLYADDIKKRIFIRPKLERPTVSLAPERLWHPQAKFLVQLAVQRFRLKQFDDPDKLVPLYLYPDHCQVSAKG